MIQYQYFHTGKEYVYKLSLQRSEERYRDNEKLFETVRKGIRGEAFTYAILGNEFIMLQATSKRESGLFVKGIRGDLSLISTIPVKYVDQFERSVSDSDKTADILPDGKLPFLSRLLDSFNIAEHLHHIFAKLFDALVYDNTGRQIIVNADSHETALKYLKVISMLLPVSFIKKIGFCVGSTNIPDDPMSVITSSGETEEPVIRLWFPEFNNFNFDAYDGRYYIFDTVANRDNYNKELSIAAKTIAEINLSNDSQSRNFANCISKAFNSNGGVSYEDLDRLSAIYLFNIKRDSDSARSVLSLGSKGSIEQEQAVINAIQYLLNQSRSGAGLSGQDMENIEGEYKSNTRVAHAISDSLYEYYVAFYKNLNENEKQIFLQLICDDDTGGRLNSFLQSSLRGDFTAMVGAFSVTREVLQAQMGTRGGTVAANRETINTAVRFFDIGNCHQRIPMAQRFNGEDFFSNASLGDKFDMQVLMCAVLMASAYFSGIPVECCEIRVRGLKNFLQESHMPPLKQLELILGVRGRILEICDEIPELNIDEDFDFLFNCETGKLWMKELIDALPVKETLEADSYVRSHSAERRFYESMEAFIAERLLNLDFVKKYIRSGTAERDNYMMFFNSLSREQRDENSEINDFLNELGHEIGINEEFAKYRFDFALECYSTLQESDKKKVKPDLEVRSYKETAANERLGIVEKTINTFGTVAKTKRKQKRFFSSIGIWAFFLGILSFIFLSVPAIVIPASLGTFGIQTILDKFLFYFKPEFIAIPLVIYFFDYIVYLCLKEGNRIKRANIITLFCGILPVILFVVAYVTFYFVRLPLPFIK